MMGDVHETIETIDRFVQSVFLLGVDLVKETEQEQGCERGSSFEFIDSKMCSEHRASNYFQQKIQFCRSDVHNTSTNADDTQLRKRFRHFVASKADLVFRLKGKERLRSGIDYNADGSLEAYHLFASHIPPLEFGMQVSPCVRRAQMFQILKVGDLIYGEVVGKRPFGVFVRITSLIYGRNLDFNGIDIQALCHKSELEKDHKSREHLDPVDDFEINDMVRGVICSISVEEERIAISFRSSKVPSEYGSIELGVVEDTDEHANRIQSFDEDRDYNDYLEKDPGFSNPRNIQTLTNVLGIKSKPPSSLLRSCQRWSFDSQGDATNLRKQQSMKWSMDTTAVGVENFKCGSHEKAMRCFNHALQIYEENAEALVARGALYANQNQLENAIKDFRQALIVHPSHHNACKYLKETLFERAIRLKKAGNAKEAIEIFEEVLDLDPGNVECQVHLRELQAVMSAQCEDHSSMNSKASMESTKESHQFEHVRKLIEADQHLARSNRKKKRKKKKRRKELRRKKRTHHKSISDESTSTASEQEPSSDNDEWVEKKLAEKPRPKERGENQENRTEGSYHGEFPEGRTRSTQLKSSDSNSLARDKQSFFSMETKGLGNLRQLNKQETVCFHGNSGAEINLRNELESEVKGSSDGRSTKAWEDRRSYVKAANEDTEDLVREKERDELKKRGRESRDRSVESLRERAGDRSKSRNRSGSAESVRDKKRRDEDRSRGNGRGSRETSEEQNGGNKRSRRLSVKMRKEEIGKSVRSSNRQGTRISVSSRSRSRSRGRRRRRKSRSSTRSWGSSRSRRNRCCGSSSDSRSTSGRGSVSSRRYRKRTTRRNRQRSRNKDSSPKCSQIRKTTFGESSRHRSRTRSKSTGRSSKASSAKNRPRNHREVRSRSRSQSRGLQRRQGRNRSRVRNRSTSLGRIRSRKRSNSYDRSLKRSAKSNTGPRSRSRNDSSSEASSGSSDGSREKSKSGKREQQTRRNNASKQSARGQRSRSRNRSTS